ncbi:hypothetical protein [Erythrobacter sp. SD-21]|uniref:hypothetical protein n=1 Tax=Erythrobacter sp. SD-21 TaxID=161528 RepID=UPI000153F060|nr:hypothetical protein [Erythrobacter sp. SD-21]EDL49496.1 hypothetical protein ED21_17897 [Erythrobacter sp. SD-21]
MRKFLFTAFAGAAVLAPAPLLAQDAESDAPLALAEPDAPLSGMAEKMKDPEQQRQMALMLRTMTEVLLDMPLAPMVDSMSAIAGEDAPQVDPDATLRSLAPGSSRVPEEIEKTLPRALDTMGSMAEAFDTMMPALRQMGREMAQRMKETAPQAD